MLKKKERKKNLTEMAYLVVLMTRFTKQKFTDVK